MGLTAHPVRFSSLTTIRRRLGFRPDIGSRRSPFPFSIQPLTRMGFQGAQFSDPIWRLGPHLRITSEPWMVSAAHRNRVVHHPWFFRLTGEGRIPSGCYPSPLPPPFGKDGSYRIALFPGLPGGSRDSLIGDPMKFGFSHSRMFPFQGFPHSPHSLDSLAAREVSAVAFLTPWRGALGFGSSFNRFRKKFHQAALHSSVYRQEEQSRGTRFQGAQFPSRLATQQTFEDQGSLGASYVPLILL